MKYSLSLNSRPFESIKSGIKKIEGRVPTGLDKNIQFDKFKAGDIIVFTNNENKKTMKVRVLGIRHYKTIRLMLETEGIKRVLSSQGTIEEGIESYNRLEGYKESVKKYGIYAIEIVKI
ncbi:ASCH domain-containing protein [Candidatus Pacearchaeota archaeon]|nr:ASCH domain-containing protein [Candidatus Pacearchaeota archaeon]